MRIEIEMHSMTTSDRLVAAVTIWLGALLTMTLAGLGIYAGRQAWLCWRARS